MVNDTVRSAVHLMRIRQRVIPAETHESLMLMIAGALHDATLAEWRLDSVCAVA